MMHRNRSGDNKECETRRWLSPHLVRTAPISEPKVSASPSGARGSCRRVVHGTGICRNHGRDDRQPSRSRPPHGVHRSRGKVALLKLAYDWSLVGDDAPIAMSDRQRSWPSPTHDRRGGQSRCGPTRHRHRPPVDTHDARHAGCCRHRPGGGSPLRESPAGRPARLEEFRGALRRHHHVASRARPGSGRRPVWALLDPGLYDRLVVRGRWGDVEFASWLAAAFAQGLLPAVRKI